jgi:glutamine synthetase
MKSEPLTFICTSDIAGKLRGKAVAAKAMDGGTPPGVGWTPTNVQITCFDTIAPSPYGALGDAVLVADPGSRAVIDFNDGGPVEDMALGDVVHLDGRPWECCTRSILRASLERLQAVAGLTLHGAFEHEFHMPDRRGSRGEGFALAAFRSERPVVEGLSAALAMAGIVPETIMKEYGPNQFEIAVRPTAGIAIADQAALLREIARATGERLGRRISFAPLIEAGGIGNGVHVHLSFRDSCGQPATYDAAEPHGMAGTTGAFIGGVLYHLPAIIAFLAPSVVSYHRLVPHRWSAAFNNLGAQDREAAVRLCPIRRTGKADPAAQFNFEIRACDAAASPHLALAAIVHAGARGIEAGFAAPEVMAEDLSLLSAAELAGRDLRRLPGSLAQALDELESAAEVRAWFPDGFTDIYLDHKRNEIETVQGLDDAGLCAAYQEVY